MKNGQIPANYEIREIKEEDIDNGGLLEVYRENFPLGDLPKAAAKAILKEIKTNPLTRYSLQQLTTTRIGSLARQLYLLNQNSYSAEVR